MHKRRFLGAAALGAAGAALPLASPGAARAGPTGPGLLTVSGAIGRSNRGPFDPALDQLLAKHGVRFDRAWVFDAAMLARLPAVSIQPTLEYDAQVHRLSGPLLSSVAEAAGMAAGTRPMLTLRALDGYTVALSLDDARRYRMVVATQLDGAAMGIGGLGPQWAVYDADRLPEVKDKPLKERFGLCPWGLYHIDIRPG